MQIAYRQTASSDDGCQLAPARFRLIGRDLELADSLRRMGIVSTNQQIVLTPLAGGVSSDIYRATLPGGVICVKRALGRLKVAADWQVPVERNRFEVEWMRVAAGTSFRVPCRPSWERTGSPAPSP